MAEGGRALACGTRGSEGLVGLFLDGELLGQLRLLEEREFLALDHERATTPAQAQLGVASMDADLDNLVLDTLAIFVADTFLEDLALVELAEMATREILIAADLDALVTELRHIGKASSSVDRVHDSRVLSKSCRKKESR